MYVKNAMLQDPVTTTPEETFPHLLKRLLGSRQATAAVLGPDRQLVGVVGIHDVMRKILPYYVELDEKLAEVMHQGYLRERMARLTDTQVKDFMSRDLDTVAPDDTLIKTVGIIVEKGRKTLPVVDGDKFVGMITRRSILERVGPSLL